MRDRVSEREKERNPMLKLRDSGAMFIWESQQEAMVSKKGRNSLAI